MIKQTGKKIMAVFTSMVIAVAALSGAIPAKAEAAKSVKMFCYGADGFALPSAMADGWKGDYLYFGSYAGRPLKWRILSSSGEAGNSSVEGSILLQSDSTIQDSNGEKLMDYGEAENWLNNAETNGFLEEFDNLEQKILTVSTRPASKEAPVSFLKKTDLTGQKVFFLDAADLAEAAYGYKYDKGVSACGIDTDKWWWLRSGYWKDGKEVHGCVLPGGMAFYSFDDEKRAIVPALNIQKDKILFTSDANFDKTKSLCEIPSGNPSEWKITLCEQSYSVRVGGGTEPGVTRKGNKITVSYTVDSFQGQGQLSLMISKGNYTEGNILYYGKAAGLDGPGTGSFTFDLPEGFDENAYKVYLIAEQIKGSKQTDYACEPVSFDIPPLHVHNWAGAWSYDEGSHWHKCTVEGCDITDIEKMSGYGEHDGEDTETVVEATCTAPGSHHEKCSVCGYVSAELEEDEALGHEAAEDDEGREIKAPTCTEEGLQEFTCIQCNQKFTEETDMLEHEFGEWKVQQQPTYSTPGSRIRVCTLCGEEDEEEIPVLHQHQHISAVTKQAGCETEGVMTYSCACGDTYTKPIAALNHTYGEWVWITPATETSEGQQQRTCSRCGKTETKTVPVKEHKHSFPADTWKNSEKVHWHECTTCGKKKDEEAHSWNKGTVTVQPAKKQEGSITYTCKQCKYQVTCKIPALGSTLKVGKYAYKFTGVEGSNLNVTVLGFAKSKKFSKVKIPETIKVNGAVLTVNKIGRRAFMGNNNITSVVIPDTVKYIGKSAFYRDKNIKKIVLGTGIEKIDSHAFCRLESLKTMTLKSKKLKVEKEDFFHCTRKFTLYLPGSKMKTYKRIFKKHKGEFKKIKK